MRYKYQLIFLGDIQSQVCNTLENIFVQRIKELGLNDSCVQTIYQNEFDELYSDKQPSFTFYIGKPVAKQKQDTNLATLISNGVAILPLYFEIFKKEIPTELQKINAHQYAEAHNNEYVNTALENLNLLRKNRKIFISYKRDDSSAVAHQLFDTLTRKNYEVFLDIYSINPAENFQDELHHRMTDCDVLIQLYTHDFNESSWCQEEILAANQKQIGIIDVVWPCMKLDDHHELCVPVLLDDSDFVNNCCYEDGLLNEATLNKIADNVESVRARNMAARQNSLIGEFMKQGERLGHHFVRDYRFILESRDNGANRIFIPAVGIPQSFDYYKSLDFRIQLNCPQMDIYLIYDDLRIKEQWIEHLEWLNQSLEVKTIQKKNFESWLQKN